MHNYSNVFKLIKIKLDSTMNILSIALMNEIVIISFESEEISPVKLLQFLISCRIQLSFVD